MTVQGPSEVPKAAPSQTKYIVAGVVALIGIALIAAIVLAVVNNDDDAAETETTDQTSNVDLNVENDEQPSDTANDSDEVADGPTLCAYDDASCYPTWVGLEQGTTADGIPTVGRSDAPVIIGEFGDFGCPHCLAFAPTFDTLVNDYAGDGQAQFYYFPLAFVRGEFSVTAAQAAICTIEQGAFWPYHQVLFEIQSTEGFEAFTQDYLVEVADAMGLDGDAIRTCMTSDYPTDVLVAAQDIQGQIGVTGTPSIVYSRDGGETWTLLGDRSESQIRSVIEGNDG